MPLPGNLFGAFDQSWGSVKPSLVPNGNHTAIIRGYSPNEKGNALIVTYYFPEYNTEKQQYIYISADEWAVRLMKNFLVGLGVLDEVTSYSLLPSVLEKSVGWTVTVKVGTNKAGYATYELQAVVDKTAPTVSATDPFAGFN